MQLLLDHFQFIYPLGEVTEWSSVTFQMILWLFIWLNIGLFCKLSDKQLIPMYPVLYEERDGQ